VRCWNAEAHRVWNAEIDRIASVVQEAPCDECARLTSEAEAIVVPSQKKVKQMNDTATAVVRRDQARKRVLAQQLHQHLADPAAGHTPHEGLWSNEFEPCTPGLVDPVQRILESVSDARLQEDARIRQQLQDDIDSSEGKRLVDDILHRLGEGTEKMNRLRLMNALTGRKDNDTIITIVPKRRKKGGVAGDIVQQYPVRSRSIDKGDIAVLLVDNYSYPEYIVSLAEVKSVKKQRVAVAKPNKRQKRSTSRRRAEERSSSESGSDSDDEKKAGTAADALTQDEPDGQTKVTVVYYYLQFPDYASACAMLDRKVDHFKQHGLYNQLWDVLRKWDATLPPPERKSGDANNGDDMDDDDDDDNDDGAERSASESESDSSWRGARQGRRKKSVTAVPASRNRRQPNPSSAQSTSAQVPSPRDRSAQDVVLRLANSDTSLSAGLLPKHPQWSSLHELWIPYGSLDADLKLMEKKKKGKLSVSDSRKVQLMEHNKSQPYTWHRTFDYVNDEFRCARPGGAELKKIPPFLTLLDYESAGITWRLLPEEDQVLQELSKEELLCWLKKDEALDDEGNMTLPFVNLVQAGLIEFNSEHEWYAAESVEHAVLPSRRRRSQGGAANRQRASLGPVADAIMESSMDVDCASDSAPMEIAIPAIPVASSLAATRRLTRSQGKSQLLHVAVSVAAEDTSHNPSAIHAAALTVEPLSSMTAASASDYTRRPSNSTSSDVSASPHVNSLQEIDGDLVMVGSVPGVIEHPSNATSPQQ
jgi:hypothetical protein